MRPSRLMAVNIGGANARVSAGQRHCARAGSGAAHRHVASPLDRVSNRNGINEGKSTWIQ